MIKSVTACLSTAGVNGLAMTSVDAGGMRVHELGVPVSRSVFVDGCDAWASSKLVILSCHSHHDEAA